MAPPVPPARTIAEDLLTYVNASVTEFHAVREAAALLESSGYTRLYERSEWGTLSPGGKYYFTRNDSTLIAFAVGGKYQPGNGFYVIGAHTDSPCFKLKPTSRLSKSDYSMLGVQPYGGMLAHTWFDRDLSLAGRVLVRRGSGPEVSLSHELVSLAPRALLRIPMLAIHLQRDIGSTGFNPNKQTHCTPLFAAGAEKALGIDNDNTLAREETSGIGGKNSGGQDATTGKNAGTSGNGIIDTTSGVQVGTKGVVDAGAAPPVPPIVPAASSEAEPAPAGAPSDPLASSAQERHDPLLLSLIAEALGVAPSDIVDFDLNLIDTQPGAIGGGRDEFIFVGRLDNLCSSFLAIRTLIDADDSLQGESGVRVAALFDNEEVGSDSAQGAGGPVLGEAIERAATSLGAASVEGGLGRTLRASFLLSADMAHALHPNYPEVHDATHAPRLGAGPVIKHNANLRYATTAVSASLFRAVARAAGVPVAEFAVRSDMACGSTIGPILSAGLGIRTVDVGLPQLAMHSIRETTSVRDVWLGYRAFLSFYTNASELDARIDATQ